MRPCSCNRITIKNGYAYAIVSGECDLCLAFHTIQSLNIKWGGNGDVLPMMPPVPSSGNIAAPAVLVDEEPENDCIYYGDELSGEEKLRRQIGFTPSWTWCDHPRKPLGMIVCKCKGCGPTCSGFSTGVTQVIDHGAGGIGDGLLGLCVVAKLKQDRGEHDITYRAGRVALDFIRMFDVPVVIAESYRSHSEAPVAGAMQMNAGYSGECRHDLAGEPLSSSLKTTPRWERYARNVSSTGYVIPQLKHPDRVKALGIDHAERVVLCPRSTDLSREWGMPHWVTLENLLIEAGYQTTILHTRDEGIDRLRGEKVLNAQAERVAGIMLNAAAVIGTDHGLSHLGGILGVSTIVLGGGTPVQQIFGLYPRVTCLQGELACSGCCGGSPADQSCRRSCANLQAITPRQVFTAVENVWLKSTVAGGRTLLTADRLASIRDAVRSTNHLDGDVGELGVFRGGSAKLIQHFAPDARLHLFDTFTGIPENDSDGIHQAGEFACGLEEVRAFVGQGEYHVGWFPTNAPDRAKYRFVHVDGDTYQTTKAACDYFAPRMVAGGFILWDDYGWINCPGVAKALHEAFPGRVEQAVTHQARVRF